MLIRMISHISGGREDGRDWPEADGLLEVPDAEGAFLVRGGMAHAGDNFAADRLAEMGVAEPDEEPAAAGEPAAGGAEPAEAAEPPGPAVAAPAAVADGEAEAGPPAPSAYKQDWIDYAVSQGADPEQANAMTKVDLMSRYGGRL
jgi:hypothetical protein